MKKVQNPFATDDMASGYATSRPPVHPRVIELMSKSLDHPQAFPRALDVGCGAGLSTRALDGLASQCIGMEPAEPMLRWTSAVAPRAQFIVGRAEAMPVRDHSIDLITAAGSLNYVELEFFFPEAARVLTPRGLLVVYDFQPGKSFRQEPGLEEWFAEFTRRFPLPPREGRTLNPEILSQIDSGFRLSQSRCFEIGIVLSRDFYLDYMLTETNVAAAVRGGTLLADIRSWCAGSLAAVWGGGEREILFRGYFACLGGLRTE
jgi:SAM-dependent methyltransferase